MSAGSIASRASRAAGSLSLGLLALACSGGGGSLPARPHLFLISADALRADHTSLHGYARATTPQLEALAADGYSFDQAITLVPKTGPSFATHWTGLPPAAHGVTSNRFGLPAELPVLAERLRQQGYRTAAFVSNPILARKKGFDRGFERYEEFPKDEGLDDLQAAFASWAEAHTWRQPTFVWIHYIDPHGPYTPPSGYRDLFVDDEIFASDRRIVPLEYTVPDGWPPNRVLGAVPAYQRIGDEARAAWYVSQYDAEIRYMDAALGSVLGLLRGKGLYEASGVVFTSDHGESLGEHDYFFEHGWFVYDATLRVPLVVKPPGGRAGDPPARSGVQVSNLDTLPTLLAMAGGALPDDLPGRNLLARAREASSGEVQPLVVSNPSSYPERTFGLRTPALKYVREEASGAEELYALDEDPHEEHDLAAERPDLTARTRAQLAALRGRDASGDRPAAVEVEISDEERAQLERLGYADP